MSRVAFAFALVLFAQVASAAELPPGALVRLGDDRFRAGGCVHHLALSPDGKQFATTRSTDRATLLLTVWDAATGRPVREQEVNVKLFKGFVVGTGRRVRDRDSGRTENKEPTRESTAGRLPRLGIQRPEGRRAAGTSGRAVGFERFQRR